MERVKQHYEAKAKQGADSARRGSEGPAPKTAAPRRPPSARTTQPPATSSAAELENVELREQVERLREKCNHLAQKVVNQEQRISAARRPSFASADGPSPIAASPRGSAAASPMKHNQDLTSMLYPASEQGTSPNISPQKGSPNGDKHISSSKRLNPFESAGERTIPDIMKQVSKLGNLQQFGSQATTVKVSKFYNACKETGAELLLDDIKRLVRHLNSLRDGEDEASFLDQDDDAVDIV